jgi:hypothetical protein
MKKFLIFTIVGIVIIVALIAVVGYINEKKKKSFSPEDEISFTQGDLKIKVFYNRPFKKGRDLYGGLVPYGKVWRTGANEATTFETNKPLVIEGKTLPPGKYSLWTVPDEDTWIVIFNSEYGQWGINSKGEANRDPAKDVLSVDVMPVIQDQEFEQFTIAFENTGEDAEMVFMWDKTLVAMPFSF